jgi:putative DNA-invertase from lambdoid prophage Rac
VLQSLGKGQSVSEVARRFNTSRQTVLRIRSDGARAAAGAA